MQKQSSRDELRALLAASGLTQVAAAKAIGVTPRLLQYNLAGKHPVELRTLLALRWVISEQQAS